jgi:hypothetical protein
MNDEQLSTVIRERIVQQINKYEPLAQIIDIQFKMVDNEMKIRITYRVKDITYEQSILEFSLQTT